MKPKPPPAPVVPVYTARQLAEFARRGQVAQGAVDDELRKAQNAAARREHLGELAEDRQRAAAQRADESKRAIAEWSREHEFGDRATGDELAIRIRAIAEAIVDDLLRKELLAIAAELEARR